MSTAVKKNNQADTNVTKWKSYLARSHTMNTVGAPAVIGAVRVLKIMMPQQLTLREIMHQILSLIHINVCVNHFEGKKCTCSIPLATLH
jgi:hypothetical protein